MSEEPTTVGKLTFLPSSVIAVEIHDHAKRYGSYKAVRIYLRDRVEPITLKEWSLTSMGTSLSSIFGRPDPARTERNQREDAELRAKAEREAELLRSEVARWLQPIPQEEAGGERMTL